MKRRKIKILEIAPTNEIKLVISVEESKKIIKKQKEILRGRKEEKKRAKKTKRKAKQISKLLSRSVHGKIKEEILPLIYIKTVHIDKMPPEDEIIDRYRIGLKGKAVTGNVGADIIVTKDYYLVDDPPLTEEEYRQIEQIMHSLFFLTDSFNVSIRSDIDALLNNIFTSLELTPTIVYFLRREIQGYGVLDPLIRDDNIQDIQIPAPGVPTKVIHKELGVLETNIVFNDDELNRYIEKFIHKANKSISRFRPYASIQLPEGHRLTVSYQREITMHGPSMVIRKFSQRWNIAKLIQNNTISPEIVAYLMLLIEHKESIIVAGEMGSGKTSLINGLCNLIPPDKTVVTIEDTPELKLPHKYWIAHVTREALTIDGRGTVSMFDLVKHALRESADYIIVGEVRGEEGKAWAQGIATGHGGITSFHADSPHTVIMRLTTPPINVEKGLLTSLFAIVMIRRYKEKSGREIKRVSEVYDVTYEEVSNDIIFKFNPVFLYDPRKDKHYQAIDSITNTRAAKYIMKIKGWSERRFLEEYNTRVKLFKMLKEHLEKYPNSPFLSSSSEISKLMWKFHRDPQKAFEYLREIEEKIRSEYKTIQLPHREKGKIKILEVGGRK